MKPSEYGGSGLTVGRSALEELYRRIPDIKADLDETLDFVPAVTLRGMRSISVRWGA